jgi:hypothetical protein
MGIMSKIKTNPTYREIARLLRLTEKSEEVFIEAYYDGQSHTQMIQHPIAMYNSKTNSISLQSVDSYGSYILDLDGLQNIYDLGMEQFDHHLHFNRDKHIEITNEW